MSDYYFHKLLNEKDSLVIDINDNLSIKIKRGKGNYDIRIIEPKNQGKVRRVVYMDDKDLG